MFDFPLRTSEGIFTVENYNDVWFTPFNSNKPIMFVGLTSDFDHLYHAAYSEGWEDHKDEVGDGSCNEDSAYNDGYADALADVTDAVNAAMEFVGSAHRR